MESKVNYDPDTSEDDQEDHPLPEPVTEKEPEQAQGILEKIQEFISSFAKTGQPLQNGQKLNCPSCGKNCHTLHQEGTNSMEKPDQLDKILSKGKRTRSTQNPPGLKLSCLHCRSPCHAVANLSSKGLPDQEEESEPPAKRSNQEEEGEDSHTPAKATDQEEGAKKNHTSAEATDQEEGAKKSQTPSEASPAADVKEETLLDKILNYFRSTPVKTKLDCPHCGQPCHSLDNNEPDSFLQMIGKLFPLSNNAEEKTELTKQMSSNSYFVGKLKCGSCNEFCHRIYKQDPDIQDSEAGETTEDPNSTDSKI